ncbi:EamA family transporter [Alphaproteobacteria bacterium GH1-50]|uniref:EamA family transporter n=1 Tax=Kangsaoukella pontilimi TaxID=2691042 RepID=A0A7C9NGN6_9RHOB|nr:DMT family transporter [Kangsaoukella pontilimi]MXQ09579.1 EamA family transporter [Kangsaoukella pontilimi]
MTPNTQGAILMSLSMAAFAINDTFVKLMGTHLPFFQILLLRSLGTVAFLGVLLMVTGHFRYRYARSDLALVGLRSVAEIGAAAAFINALFHLPLANLTAIIQALPLTVTLAAALFLREPVGWRRFVAIGIGFAGVMLIVRPGTEGFSLYSVYALLAVACVTVRDLAARRLSAAVPSVSVAFLTSCAVLAFAAAGALGTDWVPMVPRDWFWMAGSVGAIIIGYLASVMAMRRGEIGVVTQFRYSALLVALILGYLVFGDWPDRVTMAGAALIVATGLFTLWRERQARGPGPGRQSAT